MSGPRLLLVDTASLYFRAFFGLPSSLSAPDGRQVNAVRGLLDFLARFVSQYRPTHLACCWDNDWRPAWRTELVPSYKAHRVDPGGISDVVGAGGRGAVNPQTEVAPEELQAQIPMIVAVLSALGLPIVGADDHEADDVIGTLASTSTMPADVVTGDRDLFQLVDDARAVRVLYVGRGISRHEVITDAVLRDKYGIDGAGYADFATLRGDPSDGLPGVSGIGEKTAARLIADHGDIEGILAAASAGRLSPALAAKLAAGIDYLGAALPVVAVRRDLVLGLTDADLVLPKEPAHPVALADLAAELGLGASAERIVAALALAH